MNSIVFVGGVHGAGKTTISRQLAESLPASHVTAGALIRESAGLGRIAGAAGVSNKAVTDVDANQALLLHGLDVYRARIGSGPIVLDGHFSLLSSSGAVVEIPTAIYRAIGPLAVLLVEADGGVIHKRLIKRDGQAPTHAIISLLAARERARAETVCADLKIPMFSIRGDTATQSVAPTVSLQIRTILAGSL
jgi:adenylate kinase